MSLEPWKPQRIGNLNERITVQHFVSEDDGYGNEIQEWQDLATVRARVEPVKGNERVIAGGLANPYSVTFHMRYRDDVTTAHRIVYRGSVFNIQYLRNLDERRRFLSLDCETGA